MEIQLIHPRFFFKFNNDKDTFGVKKNFFFLNNATAEFFTYKIYKLILIFLYF